MKKDNTLVELLTGILFLGVLQQLILLIFFENHGYNAIGLWCGIAAAFICAIHMKRSIEDALDLDEERAIRHTTKGYLTRMVMTGVLVGVVLYFKLGNPLTVLMGVMALKLAAYMQPLMHKVFLKFKKGGTASAK